jgi:hypothetical protein
MQIRENRSKVSHVWDMKLWLSAAGLAALLLLQMGMKFVAVAQFFQHRDAIASALCVEREVPGSCGAVGGMGRARRMRQLRALLDGNQRIPLTM